MDRLIRCITKSGGLMASAADTTYLTATAQQIHGLHAVGTAALGRLLAAASLMGAEMKEEGSTIQLKVDGGGPLGAVVAIADNHGDCRGMVAHPEVELPLKPNGKLDVGGAVGRDGLLGVMRDRGSGTPYTGQVRLVSGEIAEDIASYFAISEQIPTVCALGVLVGKEDPSQLLSGGLLIQVMPGASEEEVDRLAENVKRLPQVTTMLAQGMTIEEMVAKALEGLPFTQLASMPIAYTCTCSRERVERAFSSLSPDEIRSLADENGYAEARCQYCGRTYRFSKEELETLAVRVEKRRQKN